MTAAEAGPQGRRGPTIFSADPAFRFITKDGSAAEKIVTPIAADAVVRAHDP
jgi:hypothetical protein